MQSRPLRTYKQLIVASLIALLLSTGASIFFYKKWSESEDWYIAIRNEKESLTHKYNILQIDFDKIYNNLAIIHNENNSIFILHSADSTRQSRARIYWNRYTHETHIDIQDLPDPPADKQYQLWALVDSLPLNAGVIEMKDDISMIPMKNIDRAEGWAVTLEPKGGSPEPTKEQVCLLTKN